MLWGQVRKTSIYNFVFLNIFCRKPRMHSLRQEYQMAQENNETPKDKTTCVMCKSAVCSHLSVVKYQCTLIGQALHNCLPSKESPAKRAICHCPDTKLSEKRNRKRSKNWWWPCIIFNILKPSHIRSSARHWREEMFICNGRKRTYSLVKLCRTSRAQ